jgi:uncharacterized membrane protein YfcA
VTALAIFLVVALASAVQVASGFGFALVAAPVLVAVTDPVTSVSVMAIIGTLVNVLTLVAGRRPQFVPRECATLVAWALPGLVAGVWLVRGLPADAVRAAVGFIVLAALVQRAVLAGSDRAARPAGHDARRPWAAAAAGGAAGALSTSTGLSGPPLVLYVTAHGLPPRAARDTLAVVFLVLGVLSIALLIASGTLRLPAITAVLPLAAGAGALAGHYAFERLPERAFGRLTIALLVAAALTALITAVR